MKNTKNRTEFIKIHSLRERKKNMRKNEYKFLKCLSLSLSLSVSVFEIRMNECAVHIKVYRLNVNKNFNYFGMPNCAISLQWYIHASPHTQTISFLWLRKMVEIVMGNFFSSWPVLSRSFIFIFFLSFQIVGLLMTFLNLYPILKYLLRFVHASVCVV